MSRIALLFDNTQRLETTGIYCRRAFGELVRSGRISEVEHFLPADLDRLKTETGLWDLIVSIDDGLEYDLPADVAPVVWWAIDTHDVCRYDNGGNRSVMTEGSSTTRVTWSYDKQNQVLGEHRTGTNTYRQTFTYDAGC